MDCNAVSAGDGDKVARGGAFFFVVPGSDEGSGLRIVRATVGKAPVVDGPVVGVDD